MKRCGKCGKEKPRSEFCGDRNRKDGLYPQCRECLKVYRREVYENPFHPAHRARIESRDEAHRRQKDPTDSLYWAHREKHWRNLGIENPDGSTFKRADFWELWFLQVGRCGMCGKLFGTDFETAVRKAQTDHWHKRGKYGPARALLCWLCNKRVGDLTYETGKVLWAYLSRFAPSPAPTRAPAHTPTHTHTPA